MMKESLIKYSKSAIILFLALPTFLFATENTYKQPWAMMVFVQVGENQTPTTIYFDTKKMCDSAAKAVRELDYRYSSRSIPLTTCFQVLKSDKSV